MEQESSADMLFRSLSFGLGYCTSFLIDITSDQIYQLYKNKSCSRRCFSQNRHEHLKPLLKKLHWLSVKERILFKIATFAFRFFDNTLSQYLSSSVYTQPRTRRFISEGEKIFPVQYGNLRALGTGHSLLRFLSSEQPFSLHPTQLFLLTVQNFPWIPLFSSAFYERP